MILPASLHYFYSDSLKGPTLKSDGLSLKCDDMSLKYDGDLLSLLKDQGSLKIQYIYINKRKSLFVTIFPYATP